jgi:hypothetical protein
VTLGYLMKLDAVELLNFFDSHDPPKKKLSFKTHHSVPQLTALSSFQLQSKYLFLMVNITKNKMKKKPLLVQESKKEKYPID